MCKLLTYLLPLKRIERDLQRCLVGTSFLTSNPAWSNSMQQVLPLFFWWLLHTSCAGMSKLIPAGPTAMSLDSILRRHHRSLQLCFIRSTITRWTNNATGYQVVYWLWSCWESVYHCHHILHHKTPWSLHQWYWLPMVVLLKPLNTPVRKGNNIQKRVCISSTSNISKYLHLHTSVIISASCFTVTSLLGFPTLKIWPLARAGFSWGQSKFFGLL